MTDHSEKPNGYVSRTLSTADKSYCHLKKSPGCVFGVKRFHSYLLGHLFTLVTDHKSLLSLLNCKKAVPAQASTKIQRWALTLAIYEYTLVFKNTNPYCNADVLNRLPLKDTVDVPLPQEKVLLFQFLDKAPVSASQICIWTQRDPVISKVMEYIQTKWSDTEDDVNRKPYFFRTLIVKWLYSLGKQSCSTSSRTPTITARAS